jgi:hypothetical protein
MNRQTRQYAARAYAGLALALALLMGALPAQAADAVFPTGSRLGLVPPPGMVPSLHFEGFEDAEKNAAILFNLLPVAAYDRLDKSMIPEVMKKQGIDVDKREPIQLGIGKGFLLTGRQASDTASYRKWLLIVAASNMTALVTIQVPDKDTAYTDEAVRKSLDTLAVRDAVPDAERLRLLPFIVGDLAGFHIDDVLPGRALMLVDPASADASADKSADKTATIPTARFYIAAMPGGPAQAEDRDSFARVTFGQIVGIKEVHVQDAEPLRISNQMGYETLAKAKDGQSDTDVMVVQWLRFGGGGFMQMIGIARADAWPAAFMRMRTIRDSIDAK